MKPIELVKASAGSGKTFFLMEQLSESIAAGVRPEGLLATTYTVKAAAELQSRIRRKLLSGENPELASRVFDGLIGTVNGVCGRLLSEYAIEAGFSPALDVLPDENADAVFAAAAAAVMELYALELEPVAGRLSLNPLKKDPFGRTTDWKDDVRKILTLARSNGLDRESLKLCAEKSAETLKQLFPASLDLSLEKIRERISVYRDFSAKGKDTIAAVNQVNDFLRFPTWAGAVRLGKVKYAKTKDPDFPIEFFREIGSEVIDSRELYEDLCAMIRGVFACAGDSIEAYARYKKEFGLVDFVDQECHVLQLLDSSPRFRELLSRRLSRIMVDEFQDTSPIQLALFLKLNECSSNGSIWVGDPKQAIYGFRGTDPELMKTIAAGISNGRTLAYSWRSRENLVRLANEIFTRAFSSMDPRDVTLAIPEARRAGAAGGAIEAWHLCDSGSQEKQAAALARGIAELICVRGVNPGDICVLLRKNKECEKLAKALAEWNISASAPSGTLLETPECRLVVSALRYCVNPADTAALATLLALYGDAPDWLNRLHHAKESWLALTPEERKTRDFLAEIRELEFVKKLRAKPADATPMELLEFVITALDLDGRIAAMSFPDRRMGNLEELRHRCSEYMNRARVERGAATPSGFIAELSAEGGNQAAGFGSRTVNVTTYHKAKGLEWPIVILGSLDSGSCADVFNIRVEQAPVFDASQPLKDRSIHYWPWPFGTVGMPEILREQLEGNPLQCSILESECEERRRLFYVGLTRARDQVIFALTRKAPTKEALKKDPSASDGLRIEWLDALSELPLLVFPMEEGNGTLLVGEAKFPLTTRHFSANDPVQPLPSPEYFADSSRDCSAVSHVPARRSPSMVSGEDGIATLVHQWQSRSSSRSAAGKASLLGNAFHNYIAMNPKERQREIAARLLKNWTVENAVSPETLIECAERLYDWVADRYPGAGIQCEVPMTWHDEAGTLYQGVIDMLLELPDGYVIIDHKTHPTEFDAEHYAASCAPQLRLYRHAVEAATGKPVKQTIIHLPMIGRCYEVE